MYFCMDSFYSESLAGGFHEQMWSTYSTQRWSLEKRHDEGLNEKMKSRWQERGRLLFRSVEVGVERC
jgi:hypothetical protein